MIMNKNELFSKKKSFFLSSLTKKLLYFGYILIGIPLFCLILKLDASPVFTFAMAARFGEMLEYILAALALLTVGAYLVERVVRETHKDK